MFGENGCLNDARRHYEAARRERPDDPCVEYGFAIVLLKNFQQEEALAHAEKALSLNPNEPINLTIKAIVLGRLGRHQEAVDCVESAMRLDPFYPDWMLDVYAYELYSIRRYADSISAVGRIMEPPHWTHLYVAACLAQMNRTEEAAREVRRWHDRRAKELGGPPEPAAVFQEIWDHFRSRQPLTTGSTAFAGRG